MAPDAAWNTVKQQSQAAARTMARIKNMIAYERTMGTAMVVLGSGKK
jgi:hypothetical protein